MSDRSLNIPLVTIFSLVALLASVQFVAAESVVWNATQVVQLCSDGSTYDCATRLFDPNESVTYRVRVTDLDTDTPVACGSTVQEGTQLRYEYLPHTSEDVFWFGTGWSADSPYGDWIANAAGPDSSHRCIDKNFTRNDSPNIHDPNSQYFVKADWIWPVYVTLSVAPPQKVFSGPAGVDCTENSSGGGDCIMGHLGTFDASFNFAATMAKFYGYYNQNDPQTGYPAGCWGGRMSEVARNWNLDQSIAYPAHTRPTPYKDFTLTVPTQTIQCPITVVPATDGPTKPTVSAGSCTIGAAYSILFTSTDPNGHPLKYGIDWDNDGSVDQYVPASGFVNSGVTQSASRTYSTTGQKTVRVIAQNDQGAISSSVTYTFTCNSCPIGYVLQGSACVFSACPSGYVLQSTQCVASNACTTPNYCQGKDILDGCTDEVLQSCEWSCFSGRCQGVPAPKASISAVPSLVHPGQTSSISWTSENVESCTVKSNNQDSWTGLSSPGTISNPIISQTIFTLRCKALEGATPGTFQKSIDVNIAPTWQEPK